MLDIKDIKLKDMNQFVQEHYIVMVLRVKRLYEYYVRDDKNNYAFEFMFAVKERSFSMCEVAIKQFKEAFEDD